jgi:hypothetical protein
MGESCLSTPTAPFVKEDEMMTIEERLTQLERNNRRLTVALVLAGLAAILVVAGYMVSPLAVPDEVRAHRFSLVDGDGKVRVGLVVSENVPIFAMFDENGNRQIGLGVDKNGPGLNLFDTNGKLRTGLTISKGVPSLDLFDENGKQRARLGSKDGAGLVLYDNNGKMRAGLAVLNNIPSLDLFDTNDKLLAQLGVNEKGQPGLSVYDKSSMSAWLCGGGLSLQNEKNKSRALFGLGDTGPMVILCAGDGKGSAMLNVGDAEPSLSLGDAKGNTMVSVGIAEGGGGIVDVYNPLGKRVATLQSTKTNCGMVGVYDQNGEAKGGLAGQ